MPQPNADNPFCIFDNPINSNCELSSFSSITSNDFMVMISATSFKSCELDPIPGHLLKGCIDIVIPTITKIVNMSMDSTSLPHELKEAMLNSLLKKPALDTDEFKNFRPISNLRFMSKITEKVVATQLIEYLDKNNLSELFQSAY